MRLNVGAGVDRLRAGYTTLDANPLLAPDICATVPPIPLPDASVERIYTSHFLEHLCNEDVVAFMAEAWRVLRHAGLLEIVVPYALHHEAYQDPTHRSYWVPEKALYFTPHFRHLGYGFEDRFRKLRADHDGRQVYITLRKTT